MGGVNQLGSGWIQLVKDISSFNILSIEVKVCF
jgi:hypothetical protein